MEGLKDDFPHQASTIQIRQGDANKIVRKLLPQLCKRDRAVLFLDPYGMEVEWNTVEAVAESQAIDLWLLFPLGIGVNRLLPNSGKVPLTWRRKLNAFLGTDDWYGKFYKRESRKDLFGNEEEDVVKATMEVIGRYFIKRLKTVFVGVADTPGVLRNSKGSPLYLLCYAIGNNKGKKIGLRVADHLLRKVQ